MKKADLQDQSEKIQRLKRELEQARREAGKWCARWMAVTRAEKMPMLPWMKDEADDDG